MLQYIIRGGMCIFEAICLCLVRHLKYIFLAELIIGNLPKNEKKIECEINIYIVIFILQQLICDQISTISTYYLQDLSYSNNRLDLGPIQLSE